MYLQKLLFLSSFLLYSCSSSLVVDESNNTITKTSSNKSGSFENAKVVSFEEKIECEEVDVPCEALSSFIGGAYSDGDFIDAIYYANQAIACNCAISNAGEIYGNLTRAYIEIEEDSKASEAIEKGLSYNPNNTDLIELAIWNAKRLNNINDEILYLEALLAIKKKSTTKGILVYKKLANVYRREGRYSEQIQVIKEWLKVDLNNTEANDELKLAFKKTGQDELGIDKERCNKNSENYKFCFEYAKNLVKAGRFEESIVILSDMEKKHPKNEELINKMAEVYLINYNQDKALVYYKKLVRINSKKTIYLLEISKIYQDKEKYGNAHKWAKKALRMDSNNGLLINNLAEVYKNSVESCSSETLALEDKAMYEIAYKYYLKAYKNGNKESKYMINYFKNNKKNVLPNIEDWFLIDEGSNELSPLEINPKKNCYTWVEEKVERKS